MDSIGNFEASWRRFEEQFKLEQVHVPREVVWLNGAPGAGKGVNTDHVLKTRGLDLSLCVSEALRRDAQISKMVGKDEPVPDAQVEDMLLKALLINGSKEVECGMLVEGFPRTLMQVDFLKLLANKLTELHMVSASSTHRDRFPRPLFKVVMLYVDEDTSIQRQQVRAKLESVRNKRVMDAGAEEMRVEVTRDTSTESCRKRYTNYRQHHAAVKRLMHFFPYHLIDAMGSLAETQRAITVELRYQSSLDLSAKTYAAICHIPPASDMIKASRQQLVKRIDYHKVRNASAFRKVVDIITSDIMPLIRESVLAGRSEWATQSTAFEEQPCMSGILIDILTDRGYSTSHSKEVLHKIVGVDRDTGAIQSAKYALHKFKITWEQRDVAKRAAEISRQSAEVAALNVRISQSYIPVLQSPVSLHPTPQPSFPDLGGAQALGVVDPFSSSVMSDSAWARQQHTTQAPGARSVDGDWSTFVRSVSGCRGGADAADGTTWAEERSADRQPAVAAAGVGVQVQQQQRIGIQTPAALSGFLTQQQQQQQQATHATIPTAIPTPAHSSTAQQQRNAPVATPDGSVECGDGSWARECPHATNAEVEHAVDGGDGEDLGYEGGWMQQHRTLQQHWVGGEWAEWECPYGHDQEHCTCTCTCDGPTVSV
ncbi:MAG: hypothetical protein WDW36_009784 [Sanguina aurantia]